MTRDLKTKWLPIVSFALVLGAAAPAAAHGTTTTPSGNSAINQYLETIPTANGSQPSNNAHHPGGASHSGGGGSARWPGWRVGWRLRRLGRVGWRPGRRQRDPIVLDRRAPGSGSHRRGGSQSGSGLGARGGRRLPSERQFDEGRRRPECRRRHEPPRLASPRRDELSDRRRAWCADGFGQWRSRSGAPGAVDRQPSRRRRTCASPPARRSHLIDIRPRKRRCAGDRRWSR